MEMKEMNYTKEQLYEYGMRDIPGYEGLYGITSCGRVWSYYKNRFLKPQRRKDNKYLSVSLTKDGVTKNKLIHRLVAMTYIPNPDNLPVVLHLDEAESRDHNWINNLKWGTQEENCNSILWKERQSKAKHNSLKTKKKTLCVETGIAYSGCREAERQTGINHTSISLCCNGKLKTAGGFHWQYID